jgi:hypothetical protein
MFWAFNLSFIIFGYNFGYISKYLANFCSTFWSLWLPCGSMGHRFVLQLLFSEKLSNTF